MHNPNNKECEQNKCGHFQTCNNYGCEGEHECTCPSLSETFEGDNSSLKKTFEEAARHDPENKACAQAGYGDNYHGLGKIDCTCPAQKEDPFSEFMKSQGINVVDVTPTQKEEVIERPLHISAEALFECSMRTKELIRLAEARGREAGMEKAREIVTNMENPYDIDSHLTFFQGWDQCNADVRLAIIQELNNYVPR